MATLNWPANATKVWQTGSGQTEVLVELKNITAGDTIDLGSAGGNLMQKIYGATLLATGGTAAYASATATFAGTVITIPAGPSGSTALLTAVGVSV